MPKSIFDNLSEIAKRRTEIANQEATRCRFCGSTLNVTRRDTGSAYHYEGTKGDADDPNSDTLCELCWIESDQYWKDMWDDYYYNIRSY